MTLDTEKLRAEIERLEQELETQHFTALFDQRGYDHKLKRLKKLRKQLAELEGTREKQLPVVKPAQPESPQRSRPKSSAAAVKKTAKTVAKKSGKTATRTARKTSAKSTRKPAATPAKKAVKKTTRKRSSSK